MHWIEKAIFSKEFQDSVRLLYNILLKLPENLPLFYVNEEYIERTGLPRIEIPHSYATILLNK